jgi:class 3 adenylate cyclase
VHAGECEVRGDDLAGMTVHVAARVAALARAGEVLVTGTVRDVVIGSDLAFDERGKHTLRGVPGEWAVLAVR